MVASILQKSGAYTRVISSWPPARYVSDPKKWCIDIRELGRQWRLACNEASAPPSELTIWWRIIRDRDGLPIYLVREDWDLTEALIQLCAASDEASANAGLPYDTGDDDFATPLFATPSAPIAT